MYHGEKLNSITHLVGAVLALVGFGVLLTISIQERNPLLIISFTIFGFTLILLYTMSTLYHSFHPPKLKKIFQKLDHVSIYLLIAGTYTPYMLVSLREHNGLIMLLFVWTLAVIGLLLDELPTAGALMAAAACQRIMSSAHVATGIGNLGFRNSHFLLLSKLVLPARERSLLDPYRRHHKPNNLADRPCGHGGFSSFLSFP